jgi:hypothetical protein
MAKPLTVGDIRKAIAGLPDSAPLNPMWASGPPSDSEPGVEIHGCVLDGRDPKDQGLGILVGLFYLEGDDDGDD